MTHEEEKFQKAAAADTQSKSPSGNPVRSLKYSVVIPVFNSEAIVDATISRTMAFFEQNKFDYEIILVNDGSLDRSWEIVRQRALTSRHVVAINLLRNFGQHNANLCGFQHATGDFIITMDDDLQNPPEEIIQLIRKGEEGYDLVIGQFRQKQHASYRRLGSRIVAAMNRRIFGAPKNLVLSNFRLIRRDVVERICSYKTSYPYVPGLALWFSNNRANVLVEHHERLVGKSNYSTWRIARLVATILFNYSSWPLKVVTAFGVGSSFISLGIGGFYLVRQLIRGSTVPGWTSLIVMMSFFNALILLMLGMLGEYTIRLLNQSSSAQSYYEKEVVRCDP